MDIYTVKDTDIVYETSVDFGTRQCSKEIHIVQYDSSQPIIAVELYKNSKKFVLPAGYEANVRLGKRDGTFVYKKALGTNSDGNVLYWAIDVQMTLLYGKVQPIIELLYDGAVVGSSAMPLVIDRNPVQSSDVESQAEYPAIMERLEKAALDSNVVHLTGSEIITGEKTFNESITIKSDKTIKTNEIDNANGNALVRFKSIEGKNVFGGVNYDAVLMGTSDRPYYSKSGSDFSGSEMALLTDITEGISTKKVETPSISSPSTLTLSGTDGAEVLVNGTNELAIDSNGITASSLAYSNPNHDYGNIVLADENGHLTASTQGYIHYGTGSLNVPTLESNVISNTNSITTNSITADTYNIKGFMTGSDKHFTSNKMEGVPYINPNGVMEIAGRIDFHNSLPSSLDYSTCIISKTATKNELILPSASGTLALTTDTAPSANLINPSYMTTSVLDDLSPIRSEMSNHQTADGGVQSWACGCKKGATYGPDFSDDSATQTAISAIHFGWQKYTQAGCDLGILHDTTPPRMYIRHSNRPSQWNEVMTCQNNNKATGNNTFSGANTFTGKTYVNTGIGKARIGAEYLNSDSKWGVDIPLTTQTAVAYRITSCGPKDDACILSALTSSTGGAVFESTIGELCDTFGNVLTIVFNQDGIYINRKQVSTESSTGYLQITGYAGAPIIIEQLI